MEDSKRMRISIALATFQGSRFLPEQLESFLQQTRSPDELCISDDGSSDGTLEMIDQFSTRAAFPVNLVSNANRKGASANFQNAVEQCTGDVILFSDQDDVWLPRHIERLVSTMESEPGIVAVASNSEYVDENLKPTGQTTESVERFPSRLRDATMRFPENQFELVLRHRISAGHGIAFRRELLPLLLPFSSEWMYDQWVFILSAAAGKVTYVPEPQTLHRQHGSQAEASRRIDLQAWAEHSKTRSEDQENKEARAWRELLLRVREKGDLLPDAAAAEYALQQKVDFIVRRSRTRRQALPSRVVFSVKELVLGRYHRWGRGLLTFARDVYGVRQ
jgi:glycosyltransferase involved in cell wall biosynthesis